jgi:hypothetical protein
LAVSNLHEPMEIAVLPSNQGQLETQRCALAPIQLYFRTWLLSSFANCPVLLKCNEVEDSSRSFKDSECRSSPGAYLLQQSGSIKIILSGIPKMIQRSQPCAIITQLFRVSIQGFLSAFLSF